MPTDNFVSERAHRAIGAVLCVERLHEVALLVLIAKAHDVAACPSRAWLPTCALSCSGPRGCRTRNPAAVIHSDNVGRGGAILPGPLNLLSSPAQQAAVPSRVPRPFAQGVASLTRSAGCDIGVLDPWLAESFTFWTPL